MDAPAVGRGRSGGRRGSPTRSRPGSTPGRSATSARRSRRSRAPRTCVAGRPGTARPTAAASRRSAGRRRGRSLTRSVVWSRVTCSITSIDGRKPPGKMYLLIQVNPPRVASIRSCGMVIAWMPTLPPGASTGSIVEKYDGQYSAPTASIISTDTHGVVLPAGVGGRDGAVVAQLDVDPVGVAGRGDPLAGQLELLGRERDRVDVGAAAGGADRELAPAGADLEHPGALADAGRRRAAARSCAPAPPRGRRPPEVPAARAAVGVGLEQRRGVAQRRVEEQPEQVVGQVVVVGDQVARPGLVGLVEVGALRDHEGARALQPRRDQGRHLGREDGEEAAEVARRPRRRSCRPRRSRSGRRDRCGRRTPRAGGSASRARRGRAPRGDRVR